MHPALGLLQEIGPKGIGPTETEQKGNVVRLHLADSIVVPLPLAAGSLEAEPVGWDAPGQRFARYLPFLAERSWLVPDKIGFAEQHTAGRSQRVQLDTRRTAPVLQHRSKCPAPPRRSAKYWFSPYDSLIQ